MNAMKSTQPYQIHTTVKHTVVDVPENQNSTSDEHNLLFENRSEYDSTCSIQSVSTCHCMGSRVYKKYCAATSHLKKPVRFWSLVLSIFVQLGKVHALYTQMMSAVYLTRYSLCNWNYLRECFKTVRYTRTQSPCRSAGGGPIAYGTVRVGARVDLPLSHR